MRVNSPRLVNPAAVIERHGLEQLGVSSLRTIGQRQDNLAAEKQLGGKPPIVDGYWADGSAGQSLAERLGLTGDIRDGTELGVPTVDPFGRETMVIVAQAAADTASTTSTVTYATALTSTFAVNNVGQWLATILTEASWTHSTSGSNDYRVTLDGANLTTQTVTTQTTRERYALRTTSPNIIGGTNYTFALEYRCNTAGTATARAPWMLIFFERIA